MTIKYEDFGTREFVLTASKRTLNELVMSLESAAKFERAHGKHSLAKFYAGWSDKIFDELDKAGYYNGYVNETEN